MTNDLKQFEVGRVYSCRLLSDWDAKLFFEVVKRTNKTATLRSVIVDDTGDKIDGPYPERMTCRIKTNTSFSFTEVKDIPHEYVKPLGSYSMCPTLTALKEVSHG